MYIKLNFAEAVCILPKCWNGLIIYLTEIPLIFRKMPTDISANEQVNIQYLANEEAHASEDQLIMLSYYIPKQYEYYFDCGNDELETVEEALEIFKDIFDGRLPEVIAEDEYPMINPIILVLEIAMKKARHMHAMQVLTMRMM